MRLKTRLTLAFLLLSWGLLAVAILLLTRGVTDHFEQAFEARALRAGEAIALRFEDQVNTLVASVAEAAQDTDLRQTTGQRGFHTHPKSMPAAREAVQKLLRKNATIDTLRLIAIDADGVVAAAPHRRGVLPRDAEVMTRLAKELKGPFLRTEEIMNDDRGRPERVWTVQTIGQVRVGAVLVGGKRIDDALIQSLARGVADEVALAFEYEGKRIAASFPGDVPAWPEGALESVRSVTLGGKTPVKGAQWRVFVNKKALSQAQDTIGRSALILAIGSGLLALLFGIAFSRRLSRPLEELANAAGAIAGGARDRVVRELPGGSEVAALTRAFNTMTGELAANEERLRRTERVAAWQEIARRIAHEIKNPLTPIQMSIQGLQRARTKGPETFDALFSECTETVLEEVRRLRDIVTEFSQFARLPAPQRQAVDLSELVGSVLALHREAAEGVTLVQTGELSGEVHADADQLKQVLTNLVQNSLDAIQETGSDVGRIEVNLRATAAGEVKLTVQDNGPGMNAEARDALFTPYYTTKETGTGLGLAIVDRIVAEHGGRIDVRSEEGVGTEIALILPPV